MTKHLPAPSYPVKSLIIPCLIGHHTLLNHRSEDTHALAGSDIYMAYLFFYQNVKQAAKRGVVGADTIYQNLRCFFPRGGGGTPPTT